MVPAPYILVVDDDESIREVFRLALEVDGYRVSTAENGREALTRLESRPRPCLILLDLMMPIMNGWDFVKALERNAALEAIPIVVVTAFTDISNGIKALDHIKKPVELRALLSAVHKVCGLSP